MPVAWTVERHEAEVRDPLGTKTTGAGRLKANLLLDMERTFVSLLWMLDESFQSFGYIVCL